MSSICKAIMYADDKNTAKLYLGYPDLVNGYALYHTGKMYKES